jgi:catechol 2,3-dioxygenase-like lactoylglutathione lyase family enzyme
MIQSQGSAKAEEKGTSPVRVKKLGHVVLRVRDVERSVRFYTDILNFNLTEKGPNGAFLNAVGDHHTIGLFQAEGGESAGTVPEGGVRMDHFAMEVGSLDELFAIREFLNAKGVPITFEGRRLLGGHTSVEFLDPDGNHLELYYDMDPIRPEAGPRPIDPRGRFTSLEESRDNPKPPAW